MVQKTKRELKIKNIEIETNVMASIRTAEDTVIKREGREFPAVQGYVSGDKVIKYYPGDIPSMVPSEEVWQEKHVEVRELVPNQSKKYKPEEALDHINFTNFVEAAKKTAPGSLKKEIDKQFTMKALKTYGKRK